MVICLLLLSCGVDGSENIFIIDDDQDEVSSELYIPIANNNSRNTGRANYVAHAPIKIIGNTNFTSANGVVSGNGSNNNP